MSEDCTGNSSSLSVPGGRLTLLSAMPASSEMYALGLTPSPVAKIGLAFAISGPIGAGIAAIPLIQSWLSKPACNAMSMMLRSRLNANW